LGVPVSRVRRALAASREAKDPSPTCGG
jgi:hypothetical protein